MRPHRYDPWRQPWPADVQMTLALIVIVVLLVVTCIVAIVTG